MLLIEDRREQNAATLEHHHAKVSWLAAHEVEAIASNGRLFAKCWASFPVTGHGHDVEDVTDLTRSEFLGYLGY